MPHQCPECARFLSKALVAGLATAPAACPKCEATLTGEMFGLEAAAPPTPPTPATPATPRRKRVRPPSAESVRPPDQPAVRPPDRSPAEVRPGPDGDRDVLAGWDEPGGEVVDLDAWRGGAGGVDQQTVALVAAGAGALGIAVGAALSPSGRTRGAFLGALLAGIAGAVAASRMGRATD